MGGWMKSGPFDRCFLLILGDFPGGCCSLGGLNVLEVFFGEWKALIRSGT